MLRSGPLAGRVFAESSACGLPENAMFAGVGDNFVTLFRIVVELRRCQQGDEGSARV